MKDVKQLLRDGNYTTARSNSQENLKKMGFVYYDEFGWVKEENLQTAMDKGIIRHSEFYDEYVFQADVDEKGKAIMRDGYTPDVILGYIQGRNKLFKPMSRDEQSVQRTVDSIISLKDV